jgi:O-acetyl-ADP-ribose deacetylase (regulator of RNase III)
MIHYVKGNLLDSDCDYICHQVNCQGVMGSGIARQIRERWPEVYESYRDFYENCIWRKQNMLGKVDFAPIYNSRQMVVNMFAQDNCGYDGARYTSYDAFATALHNIDYCVQQRSTIGFPKNIGCGLGGGNWNVISALIEEILGESHEVYIYEYDEMNPHI